jgi:hypothetical protein
MRRTTLFTEKIVMSYSEYQAYGKTQLSKIFNLSIQLDNLFPAETATADRYVAFQRRMEGESQCAY